MFGRKIKYEMVKFSENEQYRVTMLKNKNEYIVFVSNNETRTIGVGGMVKMTAEEADCEYNKLCFTMGIGERA